MGAGNPPPKPWECAGASSGPSPFKPPCRGSTCDVAEASWIAKHGGIVYATGNSVASNVNSHISWRWQLGSYEGYCSSMYSCYGGMMYSGGTGGSYGGYGMGVDPYNQGSNPPPKPWEHPGASYDPAPFKPPSAGSISDLVKALGTAEQFFSAIWNSIVSNANSNISRPVPPMLWQQRGSNPPPKPWERPGASYGPFKAPSAGSTIDVVEASGTAEHGEIVSSTWNRVAYNVNSSISRPVSWTTQMRHQELEGNWKPVAELPTNVVQPSSPEG